MKRLLNHARSNAIAYAALFVALGGSSYAASMISGSQIRNGSINPVKLNPKLIAGNVRAWARVSPDGHLIAGGGGPRAAEQNNGVYVINWKGAVSARCATTATVDANSAHFGAGYASAATTVHGRVRGTLVETFNQSGQATPLGFDVLVVC